MTIDLKMKQSENSTIKMGVTPSYTNTTYVFYTDKKLPKSDEGYSVFDIAKFDYNMSEFVEGEVLQEIERRRKVEPLGYSFEVIE